MRLVYDVKEIKRTELAVGISAALSRLNVLTKASAMPVDCGLCTGVKHGTRPRGAAKSSVSLQRYQVRHARTASRLAGAKPRLPPFAHSRPRSDKALTVTAKEKRRLASRFELRRPPQRTTISDTAEFARDPRQRETVLAATAPEPRQANFLRHHRETNRRERT